LCLKPEGKIPHLSPDVQLGDTPTEALSVGVVIGGVSVGTLMYSWVSTVVIGGVSVGTQL